MTAFEAFEMFIALRLHFTNESYDFIKYQGKTSVSPSTFNRRKDRYRFEKLANKKDPFGYLLSNFASSDATWVGDIISPEAEDRYVAWKKRIESLSYHFKGELTFLHDEATIFDTLFQVPENGFPPLLRFYLQGKVSLETVLILNDLTDCFGYWDKRIEEPYIWPSLRNKAKKYRRFLDVDKEKYREIVLNAFE